MVKNLIRIIIRKAVYGAQATEEGYLKYLQKKGIKIGRGCRIFAPEYTTIDIQNPHMIEIGDNVRITKGVTMLTHDYSFSVVAGVNGSVISAIEPIKIGNNVFIGINSTILKGTTVGDNVIIGAGSVVSGALLPNSVYVGVPARRIMSIEEFAKKKNDELDNNVIKYIQQYKDRYKKLPNVDDMYEFFPIFDFVSRTVVPSKINSFVERTGYADLIWDTYFSSSTVRRYDSVESLWKAHQYD